MRAAAANRVRVTTAGLRWRDSGVHPSERRAPPAVILDPFGAHVFKKIPFLIAVAIGYVLGARAGRGRYEQIKEQAEKAWNDPRVQQAATDAQEKAADAARHASASAQSAAAAAADSAGEVVDQATGGDGSVAEAAKSAADRAKNVADHATDTARKVTDQAEQVTDGATDADDLEGIDLVAAKSDVPDPRDD